MLTDVTFLLLLSSVVAELQMPQHAFESGVNARDPGDADRCENDESCRGPATPRSKAGAMLTCRRYSKQNLIQNNRCNESCGVNKHAEGSGGVVCRGDCLGDESSTAFVEGVLLRLLWISKNTISGCAFVEDAAEGSEISFEHFEYLISNTTLSRPALQNRQNSLDQSKTPYCQDDETEVGQRCILLTVAGVTCLADYASNNLSR